MEEVTQTQVLIQTLKQKWMDELLSSLKAILTEAEVEVVRARLTGTVEERIEMQQGLEVTRQRIEQMWSEAMAKIEACKHKVDLDVVGDELHRIAGATYKARLAIIEADNGFDKLCQHYSISLKPLISTDADLAITPDMVPTRIYKRIHRLGVKQLGDFNKLTRAQIADCIGIGLQTTARLERLLLQHGITFAKEGTNGPQQGQSSDGDLAPDGVQRPTEP